MAGREVFVMVLFAGLICNTDSDYTNIKISGDLRHAVTIGTDAHSEMKQDTGTMKHEQEKGNMNTEKRQRNNEQ